VRITGFMKPGAQWLPRVGMSRPKVAQSAPANDSHD